MIDPVDGTTNFVNGFPMFAASLGCCIVACRLPARSGALPATSCARACTTRARRPAALRGRTCPPAARAAACGAALAAPGGAPGRLARWDTRVTGSTASSAHSWRPASSWARLLGPFVWDVAAGVVLVEPRASRCGRSTATAGTRSNVRAPAHARGARADAARLAAVAGRGPADATAPLREAARPALGARCRLACAHYAAADRSLASRCPRVRPAARARTATGTSLAAPDAQTSSRNGVPARSPRRGAARAQRGGRLVSRLRCRRGRARCPPPGARQRGAGKVPDDRAQLVDAMEAQAVVDPPEAARASSSRWPPLRSALFAIRSNAAKRTNCSR